MRIAHVSDVHLAFRFGQRATPTGQNVREMDCAHAFTAVVDGILAARPDLVCIAGDLFHTSRPSNAAITFAYRQLRRLREAGLPVVLTSGNHDRPRVSDAGSILHLFTEIGVDVAASTVREFRYPALDLAVTAVPDRASLEGLAPGEARYRLLVIHGAIEGTCPNVPGTIPRSVVESDAWSYVAAGDYHKCLQVAPRAFYSGSTEFTSSNIWEELDTPKVWLLADLDTGTVEPQSIPPARAIHDLPPISAVGLTPAELQARMAAAVEQIPGGLSGAIVRLKVLDVPREVSRQLDHAAIRKWKATALHFVLDIRKPETREVSAVARLRDGRRRTVEELVAEYLGRRTLPPGMDQSAFLRVGAEVMSDDEYCGMPRVAEEVA